MTTKEEMTIKQEVISTSIEVANATFQLMRIRARVAAAFEADEEAGTTTECRGCVAAAEAVIVGMKTREVFRRAVAAVEKYAARLADRAERRALENRTARMRKNLAKLDQGVCLDTATFVADCPDMANTLGIVVVAAVGSVGAGDDA